MIAIAPAPLPTLIGLPAVSVAVVIGVTVPKSGLATYKVFPSGVIAFAPRTERSCTPPTWIGLPGVLVAVAIGVTVLPPMT